MIKARNSRNKLRKVRHRRVRGKVSGTKECPRLNVYRSLSNIYVQVIDDENNKVIAQADSRKIKGKSGDSAKKVGELIAEKCLKGKVEKVVFDKGGYEYHGKVKELADAARKKGLKF